MTKEMLLNYQTKNLESQDNNVMVNSKCALRAFLICLSTMEASVLDAAETFCR